MKHIRNFNESLETDKRPSGYVSYPDKTCDDCIFSKWVGTGSRSQQDFVCSFLKEGTFTTNPDATCDEFKKE